MGTSYATATINADRGMKSFKLSLDQFLVKRGATAIVSRGRALKQTHAALFASIEQRYGVPPGPLLAIWGMETAFGSQRGNQNMLSAVATLAYDCRRSEYFTDQLYAALTLIERGTLTADTRGSMHGEYGQTQFMPKSILQYGTGNLDSAAGALTSTANFLKATAGARAPDISRAAEFRRDPGLERGHGLSAGDRVDGPADRRRRERAPMMRSSHAAAEASLFRPARTSLPGSAPVCSPRSKIGAPATSVAS
jgi:membrane-bound lytic murein transglycosylase B